MGPKARSVRVVLDTSVVISALLFLQGRLVWLRGAWSTGAVTPIVSRETADELIRVLAYPKFQLSENEIQTVLAAYLPLCETSAIPSKQSLVLPQCSDPDDQKFLELASSTAARALVTGDRALLDLDDRVPFMILSPLQLKTHLTDLNA